MLRKGFTLIELLVVITILAVLAGAAMPYVQNYVEEAKIAKAKTDLEEIGRAIAVYETREGEYTKGDVSDLTGRYLNKAPIDPWGKPYVIATSSGLVISGGPDRMASTTEDNITAPYQPPLALVAVKWIDRNQSGAVDIQNTPDQVQLAFSRQSETATATIKATGWTNDFAISSGTFTDAFDTDTAKWIASKTLIMDVKVDGAFTPGSDTIMLKNGNDIKDMSGSLCLASQAVRILPQ